MQTKIYESPRYLPFGDSALVVEFGEVISLEANQKVIALNNAVSKASIIGVEETVPTYRSLLIRYNPLRTTYERLVFQIKDIEKNLDNFVREIQGRRIIVPVVYGGEYGPDISFVAQYHGITEEMVVRLHSEREYRVYMIGFVAGFPYLGEVPDEIATPRLETPRLKVPAGAVGIAEKQTGIYPCEAPGGWRIIGRTPFKLFNPLQQPPTLLRPGDIVKFKPISESEFKTIEGAVSKGEWKPSVEE
ncbi:MAG: 5-oxoprolinase subunit PxpB [Candidatus Bathyarchaeia archaeon]